MQTRHPETSGGRLVPSAWKPGKKNSVNPRQSHQMRQEVIKQEKKANFPTRTHKKIETEKRRKTIKRKKNTKQGQSGGPLPVFFYRVFLASPRYWVSPSFIGFWKAFSKGVGQRWTGPLFFYEENIKSERGRGWGGGSVGKLGWRNSVTTWHHNSGTLRRSLIGRRSWPITVDGSVRIYGFRLADALVSVDDSAEGREPVGGGQNWGKSNGKIKLGTKKEKRKKERGSTQPLDRPSNSWESSLIGSSSGATKSRKTHSPRPTHPHTPAHKIRGRKQRRRTKKRRKRLDNWSRVGQKKIPKIKKNTKIRDSSSRSGGASPHNICRRVTEFVKTHFFPSVSAVQRVVRDVLWRLPSFTEF